jgi:hypothetical protein
MHEQPLRRTPHRRDDGCPDTIGEARWSVFLQRQQECDEIVVVLSVEVEIETLVVEVDGRIKIFREAVVKIRRPRGQATQNRPLEAPDVLPLPLMSARPGSVVK